MLSGSIFSMRAMIGLLTTVGRSETESPAAEKSKMKIYVNDVEMVLKRLLWSLCKRNDLESVGKKGLDGLPLTMFLVPLIVYVSLLLCIVIATIV